MSRLAQNRFLAAAGTVVYAAGLSVALLALYLVLRRPIFQTGTDVLFWLMSVCIIYVVFYACLVVLDQRAQQEEQQRNKNTYQIRSIRSIRSKYLY